MGDAPAWRAEGLLFENCNCALLCRAHLSYKNLCDFERCLFHWGIRFEDGTYGGNAGCNPFSGTLEIDGGAMTLGPTASTQMACAPAVDELERRFLTNLGATRGFAIRDQTLVLTDRSGGSLVTFRPDRPKPLVGTEWHGLNYNNGRQGVVSLVADTSISMTLDEEGRVAGSSSVLNKFFEKS